ncbi:glutathione S-transferase [Paucibacter sp. O1-1]|uniref:glutathione S-transferase family protein n=1 Tax=Paucibacter sp. M5-1 TaxID=3015998 RepID=UPI0021D4E202|nr:glutathione S-transferase [Paucibacter sp. M5-1]MCU7373879.1 glutathione S-transferase [Paucibacter sp. O1-1]MCZ7880185.1 glutathione S-transferase [Paucibacter sp. M5-1]MDA3828881.1 glutathione S-transferase [Paucibacter sp. O1-1]
MELIGMLDSPYVRRVAISLQLLGLPFTHRSISVFRGFAEFSAINPVVKAPSLVCDDGTVLMDSGLILDYAEAMAAPGLSLMPAELAARRHALRLIGLALAGCEKTVQIVYERALRPSEKQHAPWVERIQAQARAAYGALEAELARQPLPAPASAMDQAGLTTAVVWHFTRELVPELAPAADFPLLTAYSAAAERLPAFIAAPHSDATYQG